MSISRSLIRAGLSVALASPLVGLLSTQAKAAPTCVPTPSGSTCVDPTGTCLVAFYPNNSSQALCLKNPVGPIIDPAG